MKFTKSLMKLEEQNLNAISNNMKVSQLMRFSINVILIKGVLKVETKAKIDEPFEEYIKLIDVNPVDNTLSEVDKVINDRLKVVKTGKFSIVSSLFVKMINQLKMIKLVGLM